jgi:pimeloyl-ACP methyl ester carboxylesterase
VTLVVRQGRFGWDAAALVGLSSEVPRRRGESGHGPRRDAHRDRCLSARRGGGSPSAAARRSQRRTLLDPQLESLGHDYDVVAWDAPGCGGSADPTTDVRLADYADAVAVLVRALGVGPVHLVGHSFGAGLAIEVYGRHRQLVRSLVLSGAYAGWRGSLPPAEVEARLNRALADLDRPPAEWVDSYLAGFFGHSVPRETLEAARTMMLDVRPAGVLSMLTAFANADLRAVLPTIAVPTLLIYGAEDVRAPRGVADALHAAIPARG